MREAHALADHRAAAPRERQRADEHVRRLAPRRLGQLQPVELDLLARLVRELDGHAVPAGPARLAARPQPEQPQLPHERHVGAIEPELEDLAIEHRPVDVRVIDEPRDEVVTKRLQAARRRLALRGGPGQILADRLAVTAGVPRDRRHRPAPPRQGVDLHIVLLSQHPLRGLHPDRRRREPATLEGAPDRPARGNSLRSALRAFAPRATATWTSRWGILAIRCGEDFAIGGTRTTQRTRDTRSAR